MLTVQIKRDMRYLELQDGEVEAHPVYTLKFWHEIDGVPWEYNETVMQKACGILPEVWARAVKVYKQAKKEADAW